MKTRVLSPFPPHRDGTGKGERKGIFRYMCTCINIPWCSPQDGYGGASLDPLGSGPRPIPSSDSSNEPTTSLVGSRQPGPLRRDTPDFLSEDDGRGHHCLEGREVPSPFPTIPGRVRVPSSTPSPSPTKRGGSDLDTGTLSTRPFSPEIRSVNYRWQGSDPQVPSLGRGSFVLAFPGSPG